MRHSRKLNKAALAIMLGWFAFWSGVALVGLLLTGCATTPHHVAEPLPVPVRPLLPRVYEAELGCLSDETYRRIVERERLRWEYADDLEAIISATREGTE